MNSCAMLISFFFCSFNDDLVKLSRIPILPPLIQGSEDQQFHAFDEAYVDTGETFANTFARFNKEIAPAESSSAASSSSKEDEVPVMKISNQKNSLLQWISSEENQKSLRTMAKNCKSELGTFDQHEMDVIKEEIEKTIESASRDDMKEIKGLEERLRGLENLMFDAKKIVQEQNDLAQSFQQNQARAANLGDQSILPDLCASHRSQLLVMQRNHKKLRDIRVRCSKAKDELGKNLSQRLKFVIHIESRMYEIDNKLLFCHRCLRRLQKHLGIIEQIHQAPTVYVQAVTEVVRRRIFSTAFLMVTLRFRYARSFDSMTQQKFSFVFLVGIRSRMPSPLDLQRRSAASARVPLLVRGTLSQYSLPRDRRLSAQVRDGSAADLRLQPSAIDEEW